MGMDCIPLNPKAEGFHANFTGWAFIGNCLHILGADISKMSGSNDGDVIDRATAQDWAARLQEALDSGRLKVTMAPNEALGGRVQEMPSLDKGRPMLGANDEAWMRSVIDFFERSGGFQQY